MLIVNDRQPKRSSDVHLRFATGQDSTRQRKAAIQAVVSDHPANLRQGRLVAEDGPRSRSGLKAARGPDTQTTIADSQLAAYSTSVEKLLLMAIWRWKKTVGRRQRTHLDQQSRSQISLCLFPGLTPAARQVPIAHIRSPRKVGPSHRISISANTPPMQSKKNNIGL